MLTERQTAVCQFLRRYFYARTVQIRDAVIPEDKDGSSTRECLRSLLVHGFIRRHEPRLIEQGKTTAPPIHVLSLRGSCELATATGNVNDILTVEPTFRDWMSLNHYCALTTLHGTIDAALAKQTHVKQHALYFEHEVIKPDADEPSKKYRLHTTVSRTPLIFCCPDSAFETEVCGHRRAWLVEREMGTDTPGRVIAKKHKGMAGMAANQLYKRWFPEAKDMRVLAFCPNAGWRDALRREIKGKPGAELWLFAAMPEVTADTFLHGPVFYTWDRGPLPFVPKPAPALVHAGGGRGG